MRTRLQSRLCVLTQGANQSIGEIETPKLRFEPAAGSRTGFLILLAGAGRSPIHLQILHGSGAPKSGVPCFRPVFSDGHALEPCIRAWSRAAPAMVKAVLIGPLAFFLIG